MITSGLNHAVNHLANDDKNKFYRNEREAYQMADKLSHDENGNFVREVSGWKTSKGYIILDPSENDRYISYNNQLPVAKVNGVLSVKYNGAWQKIEGHFHTHPSDVHYFGVGGDPIGVSFSDLSLYSKYNFGENIILKGGGVYNVTLNQGRYIAFDVKTGSDYIYNVNYQGNFK